MVLVIKTVASSSGLLSCLRFVLIIYNCFCYFLTFSFNDILSLRYFRIISKARCQRKGLTGITRSCLSKITFFFYSKAQVNWWNRNFIRCRQFSRTASTIKIYFILGWVQKTFSSSFINLRLHISSACPTPPHVKLWSWSSFKVNFCLNKNIFRNICGRKQSLKTKVWNISQIKHQKMHLALRTSSVFFFFFLVCLSKSVFIFQDLALM